MQFGGLPIETLISFDINTFWEGLRNETDDEKIKMLIGEASPRLYAMPHVWDV
jgi:hypothetical protein